MTRSPKLEMKEFILQILFILSKVPLGFRQPPSVA